MFVFLTFADTSARVALPSWQAASVARMSTHVAMYEGGPKVPNVFPFENGLILRKDVYSAGHRPRVLSD